MQNYIIINRTYSEITPESVEDGDFSDNGFITEREEISFRELVCLMREHPYPSASGMDINKNVWFSSGFQITDFSDGTEREECIHFHSDNVPMIEKYWKRAAEFAGIL